MTARENTPLPAKVASVISLDDLQHVSWAQPGDRIKDITESPGVYVFKSEDGEVLYVGKAKNLRNRLRSYFGQNLPPKTQALMDRARSLDIITVSSEKEALILECNLIKKHKPRYNIILKDDKNYPYLKIDLNDVWPRVSIVRKMQKDGARYFGPFTKVKAMRETLKALRRVFPLRNCTDKVLSSRKRPCLDYHIGRCPGPCVGKIDRETYMNTVQEVIRFLEGRHKGLRDKLVEKMMSAADNLDFETAAKIRDQIQAFDEIVARQRIVSEDMKDRDVLGIATGPQIACVALLPIREGKLMGREGFSLKKTTSSDDADILEAFVSQYYSQASYIPPEIVVPVDLPLNGEFNSFIPEANIVTAKRGALRDLVLLAQDNARTMLRELLPKHEREEQENLSALKDLAHSLGIDVIPRRIEGYDISNISGHEAVGSMVVMQDGKPDKASYRRFKIKIDGKPNDFAMMQEVLWRRFKKGLEEKEKAKKGGLEKPKFSVFPDLILVDGGKGQVNAAVEVLQELGLDIPIFGLAKKNEEIYLPDRSDPIVLPRDSSALYLIMRLRDEAHRFAVTYHRKLRSNKMTESVLQDIPGVGPSRRKNLLKAFGSVQGIREAPVEELVKVHGIGPELAKKIKEHLQNI